MCRHETGHTFGAVHDCTLESCGGDAVAAQQCCPLSADTCDAGERFLMNPSTQQGVKAFSPCSIGNICSALGRNSVKSDCLSANRGVSTYTRSQCGNGIVEEGEDCDCGGTESCQNNACCDAKTCKFKNNAVCDDSNEDCCKGCQFAPSTQVCRASTSECDPEEKCTGNTPICPKDETAPDGRLRSIHPTYRLTEPRLKVRKRCPDMRKRALHVEGLAVQDPDGRRAPEQRHLCL